MAIRLQIREIDNNLHKHDFVGFPGSSKIVSKFYCKTTGDNFKFTEENGSNAFLADPLNLGFKYDEIQYYAIAGAAQTFASAQALMVFLKGVGYEGFNVGGSVVVADLISSDSSNTLVLGTDGKLYVAEGGAGIVRTLFGSFSRIRKGFGNLDLTTDEAGDLFEGGVSEGVYASLAAYNGSGALNNPANFTIISTIEY